ncbi:hypothetical protein EYF80_043499 [Liparis tanakae]|uniref:Uncharacterized protein n=1 Tax=Liparis tanakae TaxID=230148 RepID=A0A4Z2FZ91_9TELE|nr:hypothetical protein EYF80_043499 [Liparis tanakae]
MKHIVMRDTYSRESLWAGARKAVTLLQGPPSPPCQTVEVEAYLGRPVVGEAYRGTQEVVVVVEVPSQVRVEGVAGVVEVLTCQGGAGAVGVLACPVKEAGEVEEEYRLDPVKEGGVEEQVCLNNRAEVGEEVEGVYLHCVQGEEGQLRSGQLFLLLAQVLQLLLIVALQFLQLHLQLVARRQLGIQLEHTRLGLAGFHLGLIHHVVCGHKEDRRKGKGKKEVCEIEQQGEPLVSEVLQPTAIAQSRLGAEPAPRGATPERVSGRSEVRGAGGRGPAELRERVNDGDPGEVRASLSDLSYGMDAKKEFRSWQLMKNTMSSTNRKSRRHMTIRAPTLTEPPCEAFREEGACVEDWAMSTRSKSGVSVELRSICLSMAPRVLTGCVGRLEDETTGRRGRTRVSNPSSALLSGSASTRVGQMLPTECPDGIIDPPQSRDSAQKPQEDSRRCVVEEWGRGVRRDAKKIKWEITEAVFPVRPSEVLLLVV